MFVFEILQSSRSDTMSVGAIMWPAVKPVTRSILALVTLFLAACRPEISPAPTPLPAGSDPARLIAQGDARLAESDFDGAEAAYQQALSLDPEFALAYSHLSYLHLFNAATRKAALAEARKAVELDPESSQAHAFLARALDWNGRFEEARQAGERATELDPNDADAHSFLGEVLTDLREYDAARRAAEKAVALDSTNPEARRNLGYFYLEVGRRAEALAAWETARDLEPGFSHRFNTLATYYMFSAHDIAQARSLLDEALKLAPQDTQTFSLLARLEADAGNNDKALDYCVRLNDAAPEAVDTQNCFGNAYLTAGDAERAETAFRAAIAADPEDDSGYVGLGYTLYVAGQCAEAVAEFQHAVELHPRTGDNLAALGFGQMCAGDSGEAIESFEAAIRLEPFDGDHQIALGRAYLAEEKFALAERAFLKAMELNPDEADYPNWLARLHFQRGDFDRAIPEFEKAVALAPQDGRYPAELGSAHLQGTRDLDQAVANFERALSTYHEYGGPRSEVAEANFGLGMAYALMGDCQQALGPLQVALNDNPGLETAANLLDQCRQQAGLAGVELPAGVTSSSPLSLDGATGLLVETYRQWGVAAEVGYQNFEGTAALTVRYFVTEPVGSEAFATAQAPIIYAASWMLVRAFPPMDALVVFASDAEGNSMEVRVIDRKWALLWTLGFFDDREFASLWQVAGDR